MLAAAPAWFADNIPEIAGGTLLALTIVVVRMVQKTMVRAVLLGLIAAVALFVYANRDPLKVCADTCECTIAGQHITVPTCNRDLTV